MRKVGEGEEGVVVGDGRRRRSKLDEVFVQDGSVWRRWTLFQVDGFGLWIFITIGLV